MMKFIAIFGLREEPYYCAYNAEFGVRKFVGVTFVFNLYDKTEV